MVMGHSWRGSYLQQICHRIAASSVKSEQFSVFATSMDTTSSDTPAEQLNESSTHNREVLCSRRVKNTSKDDEWLQRFMRNEERLVRGCQRLSERYFLLLLMVVAMLVYSPNVLVHSHNPWVYDDHVSVVRNPCVRGQDPQGNYVSWDCLIYVDYWGQPVHTEQSHKSYRPVTSFFHRLQMRMFGMEWPQLWHLTSASFNVLTVVLFYLTVRHMMQPYMKCQDEEENPSYLAGLLACRLGAIMFAVHPIHTESVSNITGLAEVLGGLFSLLSFHTVQFFHRHSWFSLLPAMIFAVMATFAKETGIAALPLIVVHLVALELTRAKRIAVTSATSTKRASIWRTISNIRVRAVLQVVLVLAFTALLIHFRLKINVNKPTFAPGMNPAAFHPDFFVRVISFLYYMVRHLGLLFFPYVLCPDYQSTGIPLLERLSDPRMFWLTITLVGVVLSLLAPVRRLLQVTRNHYELVVALAWLILPYLPASNIFVIVGFPVAERILFSPSIGLCMLVVVGYKRAHLMFLKNATNGALRLCQCLVFWSSIITVAMMAARTCARDYDWNNSHFLWLRSYGVCAPTQGAVANAALSLKDMHRLPEATQLMRFAVQLNKASGDPQTVLNLAGMLREQGNLDEAMSYCREPAGRGDPGAQVCMADIFFLKRNFNDTFNIYQGLLNRKDLQGRPMPVGKDKMLLDSLISLRELAHTSSNPNYQQFFSYADFCRSASKEFPPEFQCAITCEVGKALSQMNRTSEMRKAFRDAREACPNAMHVCMVIAEHLKNIRLYQDAIDTLKECQETVKDGNPWLFPKRATEVQLESSLLLEQKKLHQDMNTHELLPVLLNESLLNKIYLLAKDLVDHKFSTRAGTDLMMMLTHFNELFPRFPPDQISQMIMFRMWDTMRVNQERGLLEVYSRVVGNGPQDLQMFLDDVRGSLQFLARIAPDLHPAPKHKFLAEIG